MVASRRSRATLPPSFTGGMFVSTDATAVNAAQITSDFSSVAARIVEEWHHWRTSDVRLVTPQGWCGDIGAATDGRTIFVDLVYAGEAAITRTPDSMAAIVVQKPRLSRFARQMMRALEAELVRRNIEAFGIIPPYPTACSPELLRQWYVVECQWLRRSGTDEMATLYSQITAGCLDALLSDGSYVWNDGARHYEAGGRAIFAHADCIAVLAPRRGVVILSATRYRHPHKLLLRECLRIELEHSGVPFADVIPKRTGGPASPESLVRAWEAQQLRLIT